jgi:phosphoribosylformimino-5-aminoimidazole carboxamide ribonucleotide (ProFAR) isomerase
MAFALLLALDVAGGRLVQYSTDGPRPTEAFGGDPMAAARAFADAGARWVHLVDLDLAFGGEPGAIELVRAVAELGLSVQASGGIGSAEVATRFFDAGASRVVLGSRALAGRPGYERMLSDFGDAAVAGIDVQDGRIRSRGARSVDLDLLETLSWLAAREVPSFLVTAVARVGRLAGPDTDILRRVVRAGRPVIAAGGIATIEDLETVRATEAVGAVVGRAALEGGLDLPAALSWADS